MCFQPFLSLPCHVAVRGIHRQGHASRISPLVSAPLLYPSFSCSSPPFLPGRATGITSSEANPLSLLLIYAYPFYWLKYNDVTQTKSVPALLGACIGQCRARAFVTLKIHRLMNLLCLPLQTAAALLAWFLWPRLTRRALCSCSAE